jgi:hypothetical protein
VTDTTDALRSRIAELEAALRQVSELIDRALAATDEAIAALSEAR